MEELNLEELTGELPSKGTAATGDYVKQKLYFAVDIGEEVGTKINEVKDFCRKNNKKIPNDQTCLSLLLPGTEELITDIKTQIESIESICEEA